MLWIALSAAFAGFTHSLAPGHWLPVALMARARRWSVLQSLAGASVAASGHILISVAVGGALSELQAHALASYEPLIEKYAGLGLAVFGLAYAGYAFFNHHRCGHHEHSHHGPEYQPGKAGRTKGPFVFLFSLGLVPCFPALPSFLAASPFGLWGIVGVAVAFALGVLTALGGATVLARHGLARLDHPFLEHYADVVTGLGVCLMGLIFFVLGGDLHFGPH